MKRIYSIIITKYYLRFGIGKNYISKVKRFNSR